ncbi:GABA transporter [Trifolium repens]|nr:GABA transporter [Trifolium repens]KAK2397250.1 GABA transporter [Trifolium repens]
MLLAQFPSFHSLRHINLISLILCVTYATCLTIGSIYVGHSKDASPRHYSVKGSHADKLFGVFNGISIIATCYASGIIPEIQDVAKKYLELMGASERVGGQVEEGSNC